LKLSHKTDVRLLRELADTFRFLPITLWFGDFSEWAEPVLSFVAWTAPGATMDQWSDRSNLSPDANFATSAPLNDMPRNCARMPLGDFLILGNITT
jgi:hypothetical protein